MPRDYSIYCRKTRMPIFPIGPSVAYIPLTRGQFAVVDSYIADDLCARNWYAHWNIGTQSFYAVRTVKINGRSKFIRMHSVIYPSEHPKITDHKSGDTLLNMRFNLRDASRAQNVQNSRPGRRNKSGFKGVYQRTDGMYVAQIHINRKAKFLGNFKVLGDAVAKYESAAIELRGDYHRKQEIPIESA